MNMSRAGAPRAYSGTPHRPRSCPFPCRGDDRGAIVPPLSLRARLARKLVGTAAVAAWFLVCAQEACAARFALLIGNDVGLPHEERLHYAEADAVRLGDILSRLGDFTPSATVVLRARRADDVRAALADLAARMRATPGDHVALVFYSGHADSQALHLAGSSFPLSELAEIITALPATARVLILDACQAGALTRAKGGHPGPASFEMVLGGGSPPAGVAILAASTGSEMAQESDRLAGSVFTHFLTLALAGLADRDHDGAVSLGEAFDYVSQRTLSATVGTATGPQHPTFRLDMAGREALVLTRPAAAATGYGRLHLDVPGWYFVTREDGSLAAEVASRGGETLALASGSYEVSRRDRSHLEVAQIMVDDGAATAFARAQRHRVPFGTMVRKGTDAGRPLAITASAAASARTSVADLGAVLGADLSARVDLSQVSFELRLGFGHASHRGARLASALWETSARAAALRFYDPPARGWLAPTLGVGIEAGAAHLAQTLDEGQQQEAWSAVFGPVAVVEQPIGASVVLRFDVAVPVYLIPVTDDAGGGRTAHASVRAALGAGASF